MDPLRLIAEEKGVFLTQEALAYGYDDKSITRAVRAGLWTRVRRGAYVPSDVWVAAEESGHHAIRRKAVHRSYGDKVAFSHVTAALMQGVRVWGVDLDRVHVTRLDGAVGRIERDVVHHNAYAGIENDLVRVDGCLTVPPVRAAMQLGLNASTESALVALDSVLHRELGSATDIGNVFDRIQHWPHSQHLQVAVRMAHPGGQSVGETRTRWMFRCYGVEAPELQCKVFDHRGRLIGITDFGWRRRRVFGEFDGRIKYGRLLKEGQTASDVVWAEKRREDEIRQAERAAMARVIWADLSRPRLTCAGVTELLAIAG